MPIICIKTMRRSGTHRTIDNLATNFERIREDYKTIEHYIFWEPNNQNIPRKNAGDLLADIDEAARSDEFILVKSHLLDARAVAVDASTQENQLARRIEEDSKKIYVFRDPRDMFISFQRYLQITTKKEHSLSELLREGEWLGESKLENVFERWRRFVRQAKEDPSCLIVRFEDWDADFNGVISRVADFLDCRAADELTPVALRSAKSTAREPGSGEIGGWRDVMSPADVEFVANVAGEELALLGYSS